MARSYTNADIAAMQKDAINRVMEMDRRAKQTINNTNQSNNEIRENQKYLPLPSDSESADNANNPNRNTSQNHEQNRNISHNYNHNRNVSQNHNHNRNTSQNHNQNRNNLNRHNNKHHNENINENPHNTVEHNRQSNNEYNKKTANSEKRHIHNHANNEELHVHSHEKREEHRVHSHEKKEANNERKGFTIPFLNLSSNSFEGFLDRMGLETEVILLVFLALILMNDGADITLLLALGYIIL